MEIKTNTLILTFNTPNIPDCLKICYLNIPVTQYVPNPIKFYKCQRFGHVTGKCKHNETCARCSEHDTRTIHALRNMNALTVEKSMHHINAVVINESMIFSIFEYHRMFFFEARAIYI